MIRVAAFSILALAACEETPSKPPQTELATVVDLVYAPAAHGTGMSTSGHLTFVNTAAAYGVVFECTHGRFAVTGSNTDDKKRWSTLKKGQRVRITYTDAVFGDGYRFINAEVIQ